MRILLVLCAAITLGSPVRVGQAADLEDGLEEFLVSSAISSFLDLTVVPIGVPDTATVSAEVQELIDTNVEEIQDDGEDIPHTVEQMETIVEAIAADEDSED